MSILEVDIEDKVVKWAQKRKFLTPKVKFVETGYPDRLFISPVGHTIFIEFKRPGKVPDPIQNHRLEELRKRGVPAVWCDSVHEAIGILNAALETVLETSPVPDQSDQASIGSGVSRALSRPGPREDLDGPSSLQNTEGEKSSQKDADNRPEETRAKDVAGRTGEVVRLLRPNAYNPTWGPKGPKS